VRGRAQRVGLCVGEGSAGVEGDAACPRHSIRRGIDRGQVSAPIRDPRLRVGGPRGTAAQEPALARRSGVIVRVPVVRGLSVRAVDGGMACVMGMRIVYVMRIGCVRCGVLRVRVMRVMRACANPKRIRCSEEQEQTRPQKGEKRMAQSTHRYRFKGLRATGCHPPECGRPKTDALR
jgi:hypothetical protein